MAAPKARFELFRTRAVATSALIMVVCGIALVVVASHSPSAGARQGGRWTPLQANLALTMVGAVLSIALISLIYEIVLRESHGRDLRQYLRLSTAMSQSGLDDVSPDPTFDWRPVLSSASSVTALVIDPSGWVPRALPELLTSATERAVDITLGVPNPDGPLFEQVATRCGLVPDELRQNVELAVRTITNQWTGSQGRLHAGSRIRVAGYNMVPGFELVLADRYAICMLGPIGDAQVGDSRLTLAFHQDSAQYPSSWLRPQVEPLSSANELWEGKA